MSINETVSFVSLPAPSDVVNIKDYNEVNKVQYLNNKLNFNVVTLSL
jgi:hypothetical protein